MKHDFKKIEIRIEHVVHNKLDEEDFYFIYAHIDNRIKIIGKSKNFPDIFKYKSLIED